MPMSFSGDGIITGLVAGGLPNNTVITDDIVNASVTAAKIASGVLGASLQVFTSSGTYTPTAGKTSFLVFATGGGGGGGGNYSDTSGPFGGSGGGGGTAIRLYTAEQIGSTVAITIGGGGSGGINGGTPGGTGGTTSFTISAPGTGLTISGSGGGGGSQGGPSNSGSGGGGGGATNSLFSIAGGNGATGVQPPGISFWAGGQGRGNYCENAGVAGVVVILEW